jgi:hypothetical protein
MTRIRTTIYPSKLKNKKSTFNLLAGCLVAGLLLNLNAQAVFADSEFSTADMNTTGYGGAGTGSTNQSSVNEAEAGYHTGQALDGRAMPKEISLDNSTNQTIARPGVTNGGGSVLNGLASQTSQLDKVFGGGLSKLPATETGSFVAQSGFREDIYGDEGIIGPPPLFDFSYINSGINSGKLTTGHKSSLPSAWGYPN